MEVWRVFAYAYPMTVLATLVGQATSRGSRGDLTDSSVATDIVAAVLWPLALIHGVFALLAFKMTRPKTPVEE